MRSALKAYSRCDPHQTASTMALHIPSGRNADAQFTKICTHGAAMVGPIYHCCIAGGSVCKRCTISSYAATVLSEDALLPDATSDFLLLGPVHHVAVVDWRLCLHDLTLLLCPWLWLHCLGLHTDTTMLRIGGLSHYHKRSQIQSCLLSVFASSILQQFYSPCHPKQVTADFG